jgi:hypothetical protein
VFAVLVIAVVVAIALSSSGSTPPFGWVLLVLVPMGFAAVLIRTARQSKRARPLRDSVLADSVVAEFPRVSVQLNPGSTRSVSLKGGPFGVEVLVKTHSFEVGPAPPLRGSFRYYFEASETDMQASEERFSNFWVRDCILLSGSYGGGNADRLVYEEPDGATLVRPGSRGGSSTIRAADQCIALGRLTRSVTGVAGVPLLVCRTVI